MGCCTTNLIKINTEITIQGISTHVAQGYDIIRQISRKCVDAVFASNPYDL